MIVDIIYGFLGAGKTTFITNALRDLGKDEKTVVLVNEFGEVGIDGGLLEKQGGNVIEMPSGCICCTLQTDFRSQLLEITRNIQPDRVIIEPTGVATIRQIHSIVGAQLFEEAIEKTHSIMIADAVGFMDLYKANRHFVESQVENADLVLLNKCDRADKRSAQLIRSAVSAINPRITVMMTEFGRVDWAEYRQALSTVPSKEMFNPRGIQPHYHHHREPDELGYQSFGKIFSTETFNEQGLETFFQELVNPDSRMGRIVRAKGIFRVKDKWVLMELASGDISSQPMKESQESRVSIIGTDLNQELLTKSFSQCIRST